MNPHHNNGSSFLHFSFLRDIKVHGIYLSSFERLLTLYPILKTDHTHDFYSLLFFKSGEGTIKINNNSFSVRPNTACLISPCQIHSFEGASNMEGTIIFFHQDFYVEEFSFLRLLNLFSCTTKLTGGICNPCLDLAEKDFNRVGSIVNSIDSEYENFTPSNNSATIIRSLLNIMLLRLTEWNNSRSEIIIDSDTVLINELSRLVDTYYIKEHNVGFYTAAFNISEKHLNDLCQRHFNSGLKKILKERLMQEARKLLLSSELSVSEISYKLNFEDNSYFSKVFKQETRLTPKKFRDIHKRFVP